MGGLLRFWHRISGGNCILWDGIAWVLLVGIYVLFWKKFLYCPMRFVMNAWSLTVWNFLSWQIETFNTPTISRYGIRCTLQSQLLVPELIYHGVFSKGAIHNNVFTNVSITSSAQNETLQKYFSHPSLVIFFLATPPIKLKVRLQIGGRLLIANHLFQSSWLTDHKRGAVIKSYLLHSSLVGSQFCCAFY
jgi:hypothetical protein